MKLLFLVLIMGICVSALAQVAPLSAVSRDTEPDKRAPLPAKAGMFGIEDPDKPTLDARSNPSVRNSEKPEEKATQDLPSNEDLGKLIRAQTQTINLLFIELNSLKERVDKIETGRR